jgi:aminoglycoside phosphotransferase (APT) family kinase protein
VTHGVTGGATGTPGPAADHRALTIERAAPLIARARPGARIAALEPLSGGLVNTNYRVRLADRDESLVLRFYERGPGTCVKERDLLQHIGRQVPVAEMLLAEPGGHDGSPPFAVLRYVDGLTLQALRATGSGDAVADASYSAGLVLARMARFTFPSAGRLEAGPRVGAPLLEGDDAVPRFVDQCLDSEHLQARLAPQTIDAIHAFAWRWAPRYAETGRERSLVHCDYGTRNILVHEVRGRWEVAAVIDWEFAVAATPLIDVGHFLRYEQAGGRTQREPFFSRGCLAGGLDLPADWRPLARALDLTALVELLTREILPPEVAAEVAELVVATVDRG